jgi:hypothetical protein
VNPLTHAIRDGGGFWTLCDVAAAMRAEDLGFQTALASDAMKDNARMASRERRPYTPPVVVPGDPPPLHVPRQTCLLCDESHMAHGLCNRHMLRWKRWKPAMSVDAWIESGAPYGRRKRVAGRIGMVRTPIGATA